MRQINVLVMLSIGAAAVVTCGRQQTASHPADSTAVAAGPAAAAVAPNVVTVHANDYSFDAPSQVPAGWTTFRMINDGPGLHHMSIMRLDSGKTAADLQSALQRPGPPPMWAVPVGGPNVPEPHAESNATVNLSPGNYMLMCFVDLPGGVPHFAKGMSRPLTVTAATGPAASPPKPDVTFTLSDYKFDMSGPLTGGHHDFLVNASVGQPHELELVLLNQGKTAADMLAWLNNMKGPPPGHPIGGIAGLVAGTPVYFSADIVPGTYMLVCFLPDAVDGKPHLVHGMVRTVVVT